MTIETNDDHQTLVRELINKFSYQGIEVTAANFGGHSKPEAVRKYKPDIIGWDGEKHLYYFGTVVTNEESLNKLETREKFSELSKCVMKNGKSEGLNCPYYIVVPKQKYEKLQKTLYDIGISSKNNIHTIGV
jgi:hypothetical protein